MAELDERQAASEEQIREGQAEEAGTAEAQAAEESPRVNLDDLPEFRSWKSTMDKRLAQERKERDRLAQELEATRTRLDEVALRDADPSEQVEFYRKKVAALEEGQRLQAQRQQQVAEVTERANAVLERLGLTRDTPGLDWSGDPTEDGFERLVMSAVELASRQQGPKDKKVEAEMRKARQQAIKETGAVDVSTAKPGASPTLEAEYRKRLAELTGSNDMRAYVDLKTEFREKGLDV